MITLRKAHERGHTTYGGWLQSAHTFSFGDYFDPRYQGYGNLRVINDDTVAPGHGFGTHGHRDMEIISYVLSGQLAHKDSMGNGETDSVHSGLIRPGDIQRMSAGTGVLHSEYNNSLTEPVHFLQIWIQPKQRGIAPSYEQKQIDPAQRRGKLALIVSPEGGQNTLSIHADARLYAGFFTGAEHHTGPLDPTRLTYVHLAQGQAKVNGQELNAGDGVLLAEETQLEIHEGREADILVFDLATH